MKKQLIGMATGALLAGCGGGDGGGSAPPPVVQQPAPVTPAQPPAPAVTLASGDINRQVAADTGIAVDVVIKANFTPAGTLHASAADSAGVLAAAVGVASNTDGSYTLSLSTVPEVPVGAHSGEVTIKLCGDAACATPQAVPSIKVPYKITARSANTAWPGGAITPISPWTDVPDWTTFQGNAAHTGFVPVTLDPDKFTLRWKTGSASAAPYAAVPVRMQLAASDGLFYLPKGTKMEARREADGTVLWSYDLSTLANPSVNPAAVDGGVVYFSAGQSQSAHMFGLHAGTGAVLFKTPMNPQWDSFMSSVPYDGAVYTNAGSYGGLYGIRSSGELMFSGTSTNSDRLLPAVDAGAAYVFSGSALTVYHRKTGAVLNRIGDATGSSYGSGGFGAAVIASAGSVIAGDYTNASWNGYTNALLKFNVDKGYLDWRVPGSYAVTPAYAKGVVYAANRSPYRLEARAESDGALRWSWTPPVAGETSWYGEPIVTNNLVFVSTDKHTYAVDQRSGKAVWSYPLAGRLALTRSGILYINADGALVAVNVK